MSEQIDLHAFKAITAASCVDNIVNKPYTSTIISTCSTVLQLYIILTLGWRLSIRDYKCPSLRGCL